MRRIRSIEGAMNVWKSLRIRSHSDLLPTDCVCILTFADFELRYSITSESGDGHLRFAPYAFGLRTAPYRGDCDVSCIFGNGFTCHGRNECPDQRGLYSWPPEGPLGGSSSWRHTVISYIAPRCRRLPVKDCPPAACVPVVKKAG